MRAEIQAVADDISEVVGAAEEASLTGTSRTGVSPS